MLLKLIGFTAAGMPVYTMRGGAPEEEGEGAETEEVEDNEEEEPETEEDEYKPPSREEWLRSQAALKKANGEAASRRKWLDAAGINPRTGARYDADEEDEAEVKTKTKTGDEEASQSVSVAELAKLDKLRRTEGKKAAAREAQLVGALTKASARNALRDAGWNGQGEDLVSRFIDLGEVEIDDEGNVIGLDDQIADLKASMPDWFKVKRTVRSRAANGSGAREVDGADRATTRTAEQPKSWLDKLSAQIDGEE